MKDSKKFWNKQAKNFNSNSNQEIDQLILKSKKYLNINDVVLDFACGTGDSTFGIAKIAKEVHGIDFSEEMIRIARRKGEDLTNIHFVATTIEDKRYVEGSFDVIIAFNIFHLLEEFDEVMMRIYGLLKPNGLLISNTDCLGEKKNLMTLTINVMSKFGVFPSVKSFNCIELEEKICSVGFNKMASMMSSDVVPNMYLVAKKAE